MSNENNSSAPLNTAPMIEAFEAAYSRDWHDPAGNEIKEIWHRAWQEAVAAQAAPAAVARPHVPRHISQLIDAYGASRADEDGQSGTRIGELVSALRDWAASLATPALPATEDSSAGDLAHDKLRCAVGNCTFNGEVAQHAAGCQQSTQPSHGEVQAEPVDWDELPEDANERAMFDRNLDLYGGDPRVAIATALRLWANTRGNGSFGLMCAIYANEVAKMHIATPQAQPADALDAKAPTLVEILAAQWTTWPAEQAVEQTALGDVFCCVRGRALKFGTYQIASDQDSAVVTPSQWARQRAAMAADPQGGNAATGKDGAA